MPAIAVYEWVYENQPMTEARDDFIEFMAPVGKLCSGVLAKLMDRRRD